MTDSIARAETAAPLVSSSYHFEWLGLLSPLFFILRLNAACSHIRLSPDELDVRMGWAFDSKIPLSRVRAVRIDDSFVGGVGVHGLCGVWLVNGSFRSVVRIEIEPGAPARVMGIPLTLTTLRLGIAVDERDGFIEALTAGARGSTE